MSEKPISPLRQRMLEDMSLRGFPTSTPRGFLPWGFPTTAPVPAHCRDGPSSETLHRSGLSRSALSTFRDINCRNARLCAARASKTSGSTSSPFRQGGPATTRSNVDTEPLFLLSDR